MEFVKMALGEVVVVFDAVVVVSDAGVAVCGVVVEFDVVQVVFDVVCDGVVEEMVECLDHDHPKSCCCLGSVIFQHWKGGSHGDRCQA